MADVWFLAAETGALGPQGRPSIASEAGSAGEEPRHPVHLPEARSRCARALPEPRARRAAREDGRNGFPAASRLCRPRWALGTGAWGSEVERLVPEEGGAPAPPARRRGLASGERGAGLGSPTSPEAPQSSGCPSGGAVDLVLRSRCASLARGARCRSSAKIPAAAARGLLWTPDCRGASSLCPILAQGHTVSV